MRQNGVTKEKIELAGSAVSSATDSKGEEAPMIGFKVNKGSAGTDCDHRESKEEVGYLRDGKVAKQAYTPIVTLDKPINLRQKRIVAPRARRIVEAKLHESVHLESYKSRNRNKTIRSSLKQSRNPVHPGERSVTSETENQKIVDKEASHDDSIRSGKGRQAKEQSRQQLPPLVELIKTSKT